MSTCSQCDTPAFVKYGDTPLCIRHELMLQQANWIQYAINASYGNYLQQEIARGSGYILPPNYTQIPPPPSIGDHLTFNNINVRDSAVGLINTGTIKQFEHLDASVTTFKARGNDELAESLRDFTQLLWNSGIAPDIKDEIAQQVSYLAGQAQAQPKQRSMGIVKSLLRSVKEALDGMMSLGQAWSKLQPLLERVFGI